MEETKTSKASRDVLTVTQLGYNSWVVYWKPECRKYEYKHSLHYETSFSFRSSFYIIGLEFWLLVKRIEAIIYFTPPDESKYLRNIFITTTN